MEPRISVRLCDQRRHFQPNDWLECEYLVDAAGPDDIQAMEASVLWHTEGKGDEDLGVHYFERRTRASVEDGDLRRWRRFRTRLPNSPLSYCGVILNICWCVRVRVFLRRGKEIACEQPFRLGAVPPAKASVP
jgi:hypothetical protein